MNNSLALISENEYNTVERMANTLAASQLLPQSVNTPAKAIAIILLGRELNIAPWQALSTINVIQGKPTISPQLMLALIQSSGQLENIEVTDDGTTCTVAMTRKGQSPHTETFSMQDAAAMGLSGKDNWKKQAKIMRRWRCVAACARVVFSDVILGLYTPDEMGADISVTDDGEMRVVESRKPQQGSNGTAPVISSGNIGAAPTPLIVSGNGVVEETGEIVQGVVEIVEMVLSDDLAGMPADASVHECFGVIPQPVKGHDGSFMYVCKCKGGVNITVFGADKFRDAGLHPDEWKKTPNKITNFNDPVLITASQDSDGDWIVHSVMQSVGV